MTTNKFQTLRCSFERRNIAVKFHDTISTNLTFICVTLLFTTTVAHSAAQVTPILIGRGDSLLPFSINNPSQCSFQLSQNDITPWSRLSYMNISFDFQNGGWNCGFQPSSEAMSAFAATPEQINISFAVYNPKGSSNTGLQIGVEDSTSTNFGQGWYLPSGQGWQNISLELSTKSFWSNGHNMTLPLKSISFSISNNKNNNGWIGIADLTILSGASPGSISDPLLHMLNQPRPDTNGVVVQGDGIIILGSVIMNRMPVPCTAIVRVEMRNSTGSMGQSDNGFGSWTICETAPAILAPWETISLSCSVNADTSPAGYITMRSVYEGSSCWTANDTLAGTSVIEGGLVLALPQPSITISTRNINSAVFSGQMIPNAVSASRIGMLTVREGPLWHWSQPSECWNLSTCFDWSFYDGIFDDQKAGLQVMIDARELAPPWACARNDSGGAYSNIPSPEHYSDYQHWLTIMLDRYGSLASAVEVSNEQDGYAYFANDKLPLEYAINETLSMINITVAAVAASVNASGLPVLGLSSSMFDVGQTGNGGSSYLYYERAIVNAPNVMSLLKGFTFHTYAQGVWIPWNKAPWGNTTFYYPNETSSFPGNSTVSEILIMANVLKEAAITAGLPQDYEPLLWPSEMGYNLQLKVTAGSGWSIIHAALVSHILIHMRSLPIAKWVKKAFLFAADDSCCVESDGYFGIWRPAFLRRGVNVTSNDLQEPSEWLSSIIPMAGVAAYATASALIDVPSGRLPGVFIIDNSNQEGIPPFLPSCIAFETDSDSIIGAPPLVVLMTTAHHFNDILFVNMTISTSIPGDILVRNGLGTPLSINTVSLGSKAILIELEAVALPQYIILPKDTTAAQVCSSLVW
jgi:hypothetical protein